MPKYVPAKHELSKHVVTTGIGAIAGALAVVLFSESLHKTGLHGLANKMHKQ